MSLVARFPKALAGLDDRRLVRFDVCHLASCNAAKARAGVMVGPKITTRRDGKLGDRHFVFAVKFS
jgi:hypothetical protein